MARIAASQKNRTTRSMSRTSNAYQVTTLPSAKRTTSTVQNSAENDFSLDEFEPRAPVQPIVTLTPQAPPLSLADHRNFFNGERIDDISSKLFPLLFMAFNVL